MGNRIDELEQSINDLRSEMGQDGSPSPSVALKSKEDPNVIYLGACSSLSMVAVS
nr:heat shock factor-binding protein 1-like [Ipomoea batatas]